jgi:hypothetical protein
VSGNVAPPVVNTFANYHNASGQGPSIAAGQWVQVACKVYDPTIASVNPDGYWYRIASSPWNSAYYAPANTFMNGDPYGGPYTHNTDFAVANVDGPPRGADGGRRRPARAPLRRRWAPAAFLPFRGDDAWRSSGGVERSTSSAGVTASSCTGTGERVNDVRASRRRGWLMPLVVLAAGWLVVPAAGASGVAIQPSASLQGVAVHVSAPLPDDPAAVRLVPHGPLSPDLAAVGRAKARAAADTTPVAQQKPASKARQSLLVAGGLAGASPPDATGAIGPDYYVEAVNLRVGVFRRADLTLVAGAQLDAFLGVPGQFVADPQLEYDPRSDRWLYAGMYTNGGVGGFEAGLALGFTKVCVL